MLRSIATVGAITISGCAPEDQLDSDQLPTVKGSDAGGSLSPCIDVDGDAYCAQPGATSDCDDNDPEVNPGADEFPLDAIDNDCDGIVDETDEPYVVHEDVDGTVTDLTDLWTTMDSDPPRLIELPSSGTVWVGPGTWRVRLESLAGAVAVVGVEGAAQTVLDAEGSGRVVLVSSAEIDLVGLTITGGSYPQGYGGGGVAVFHGAATLTESTVDANEAGLGGGLYGLVADFTLESSVVSGNTANYGGAILASSSTLEIRDTVIEDNDAAMFGGAINIGLSSVEIWDSTLRSNHAGEGGGAILQYGTAVTITDSVVHGNTADDVAGGVMFSPGPGWLRSTRTGWGAPGSTNDNPPGDVAGTYVVNYGDAASFLCSATNCRTYNRTE